MPVSLEGKLVVALSSRALFDFEEENRVFEDRDRQGGDRAYMAVQLDRMDRPARPGAAFPLVKKLLAFNADGQHRVEVVILSRNDPVSGLRVFRSAEAAGLPVERGVFTRGRPPYHYLNPLGAHLFLSADDGDVRASLAAGFPAARVYPQSFVDADRHPEEVRIAFDGDAVLFSDEAEQVYQRDGLPAFVAHERQHVRRPLPAGLSRSKAEGKGCSGPHQRPGFPGRCRRLRRGGEWRHAPGREDLPWRASIGRSRRRNWRR